jgi:hypothetical protein
MKIGGVTVTAPSEKILVIPRDGAPLVFRARALPDMNEFQALCPLPTPPGSLTKDGWVPNPNDPTYRTVLENHAKKRLAYLVIRTLEPSNIEWDTVDPNNPKTWANWDADLKKAGLIQNERNLVLDLCVDCNVLSEDKIKSARESFLLGQAQAQAASPGQTSEPVNTPSGPPAPESE